MNGIDIAIVIIIMWGGYSGYQAGFLMSMLSFLAIVLAVLGGFKLMGMAMLLLAEKFNVDNIVLPYIAFSLVFICIVIGIVVLGRMIKASMDKNFLGRVDQVSGAFFGLLKTAFILSVVIWIVSALRIHKVESWTEKSRLYQKLGSFAPMVTKWVGKFIPFLKDVF